jgi:hypothetical protein
VQRTIQMVGRYLDRLERRNGEWRISHRVVVPEMVRYVPPAREGPHLASRRAPGTGSVVRPARGEMTSVRGLGRE